MKIVDDVYHFILKIEKKESIKKRTFVLFQNAGRNYGDFVKMKI